MKRLVALVALAAAASSAISAQARDPGDWQLLPTLVGDSRVDASEFPLHPAPGGLALVVLDGRWHLVPATLGATYRANDDHAYLTLAASPADALAYLRLPGLVEGKVDAADMRFKDADHPFDKPALAVPFKGATWRFEVRAHKLSLTDGQRRQAMGDACGADDMCNVRLAWAGDLDRDGKPDFLIDSSSDDSGQECLYLSSRAQAGEFVGKPLCADHSH